MFRGGPAHTGVYDHAVSGRALLGLQWRFVTEGDVIGSPAVAATSSTPATARGASTRSTGAAATRSGASAPEVRSTARRCPRAISSFSAALTAASTRCAVAVRHSEPSLYVAHILFGPALLVRDIRMGTDERRNGYSTRAAVGL
jgi:hypothetical protein